MPTAPDILWIVTTQWRAGALGHAGDPNARTPALDAFAAGATDYAQAVTPHPFGPFARAALLTGVPSPENGVRDYWDALPADAPTVAHALGERGYATAFFGKWGVGERDRAAPLVGEAAARIHVPVTRRGGFGRWTGFEGGFLLNDPWLQGDGVGDGSTPARFAGYQSDVVVDRAADWWCGRGRERDAARRPRFALVSLEAPHPPYGAPTPAGVEWLRPDEVILADKVPRGGAVEARARRELAGYHAHIAATDAAVGRLIEAAGTAAILVFTSVHGDMHGAHGLFRKGWPHEDSVRVPLLVRGAPGGGRGGRSNAAVSLLDLPAMALAWSEGRAWDGAPERAEISMPCVVDLPDQCDRVWHGWRSAKEKKVWLADGTEWVLGE
jgi:arylsulfatase A-like enzyme